MRERRALRFVVEALFLGALAAALVVADLDPLEIAGVMLLGWLVVALYEWASTRELPHYGRGLPPRYYVPQVSLPPARQLDQLRSGYPAPGTDDQATWIASPAMRAEALADWPIDVPDAALPPPTPGEDTMVVDNLLLVTAGDELFHENTWIELDPVAEGNPVAEEREEEADPVALVEEVAPEPEPEPEVEPELPVAEAAAEPAVPVVEVTEPEALPTEPAVPVVEVAEPEPVAAEPEVVVAAEPEPEPEPEPFEVPPLEPVLLVVDEPAAAEPEPEPDEPGVEHADEVAAAAVAAGVVAAEPELPAEAEDAGVDGAALVAAAVAAAVVAKPEVLPEPEVDEDDTEEDAAAAALPTEPPAPAPERPARHTFDPLADEAATRRRWRRRDDPYVEMPARPPRPLALPGAPRREQRDEASA